ncbi:type 4a pilus biogenesis protein PilO [Vibrio marisflavi]|uniref:type 4a pilus biogenesis protein PilO n=1 Tax=Vibrio marisflavi TaxID=1216040 RepID=UPI001F022DFF|nr:type 4a pilus biogenesis protein PilO [Vibrio marisflavi]
MNSWLNAQVAEQWLQPLWVKVCLLAIGVFICVFTLGYWFYIAGQLNELQSYIVQEQVLKAALTRKVNQAAKASQLEEKLADLNLHHIALSKAHDAKGNTIQMMTDIEACASKTDVHISRFQWGKNVVEQSISQTPISLEVKSNWNNAGYFLQCLAHLPQLFIVNRMVWHGDQSESQLVNLQVMAQLVTQS